MLTEQSLRAQAHVMNTNLWIKFLWAHSLFSSLHHHLITENFHRTRKKITLISSCPDESSLSSSPPHAEHLRERVPVLSILCAFCCQFPRRSTTDDKKHCIYSVVCAGKRFMPCRIINYSTFPVPLGCLSCNSIARTVAHEKYPIQKSFASPPTGGPSALSHMFRYLNTLQLLPRCQLSIVTFILTIDILLSMDTDLDGFALLLLLSERSR